MVERKYFVGLRGKEHFDAIMSIGIEGASFPVQRIIYYNIDTMIVLTISQCAWFITIQYKIIIIYIYI